MYEKRLDGLLRAARYRPQPGETERFARAVMAALGDGPPGLAPLARRPWYGSAAGLAFAALALSLWPAAPAFEDEPALADVVEAVEEAR